MKKYLLLLLIGILIISISPVFIPDYIKGNDYIVRIIGAIVTVSFVVISWTIVAYYLLKPESKVKNVNMSDSYKELTDEELKECKINKNEFHDLIYKKFVAIHTALTNYDLEVLKENLTADLYNYYVSELKKFRKRKYKNVMSGFELLKLKIYKVSSEFKFPSIYAYLNVKMYDYLVDLDSGRCVSGSSLEKVDLEFELLFEKRNVNSPYVMSNKTCINKMKKSENSKI